MVEENEDVDREEEEEAGERWAGEVRSAGFKPEGIGEVWSLSRLSFERWAVERGTSCGGYPDSSAR